jgi:PHD/YefM family antitoxin component YafN of YafNO toxin-antitoxin module
MEEISEKYETEHKKVTELEDKLAELQNDLEEKEQQVLITEKKSSNLV